MKKEVIDRRRSLGERIVFGVAFAWFGIYSLSMILAIGWAFISSFKGNREFFSNPFGFPEVWRFSNYVEAVKVLKYKNVGFVGMIWNSIWMTGFGVVVGTFLNALIGYVFARFEFPGKKLMETFNIFIITVPIMGGGASGYRLQYALGLANTPWYIIIGAIPTIFGMGLIIWKASFSGTSSSYMEAATIDGAGNWTIFIKIMFPMVVPTAVAMGITAFIAGWNDYMTTFMFMDNYPTLAAGLYFYREELKYASNEPLYFAGAIISIIPPIAIFAFTQSQVFEKISLGGGLKG